ncbi:ATP-dependent RecD-like DNA helicase [uncultured Marinobacter sp.]|mgnify:FL=1|uniref:ATP-dependent RecD-like DNA helicase n=1 Tax=uncultured Marinobacter sp. TaxID=187379 RepID=UPI0030DC7EA3
MNEDYFRVTSCQHEGAQYTIFSGVPLKANSYRINSRKYIISIRCENQSLPIKPSVGQQWRVRGERVLEAVQAGDYELQQHVYNAPVEMECTLPESGEALIRFIASDRDFTGIGEAKARALWDAFSSKLHQMLRYDRADHRELLRGILSDVSVDALYNGYAKYRNLAHANWLASLGIPLRIQQRILKYHDERTVDVLKSNPYALLGFGMAFRDIDTIAERLGFAKSAPQRLAGALETAIRRQVEKGHTYATYKALKPLIAELLQDAKLTTDAFENGHQSGQFIIRPDTGTYHPTAQIMMESVVAKRLKSLASLTDSDEAVFKALTDAVLDLPYNLTEQQVQAVESSLTNSVSCIIGGAGTGKTTVLRTVLRAYNSLGYEVHAVALSGRAAMRLHESIGFFTMTIARLLREEPIEHSLDRPKHVLVIDEASMIDLPTMYRLITHLDPSVRIILTGDPNQLPPIGCGKVLSDVVESGAVATQALSIVKRQEGATGIPEYSATINRGEVPRSLSCGAITFHEASSEQIVDRCKALYAESPQTTQIVGATKALVGELNQECQRLLNPDGERLQFTLYGENFYLDLRLGDPILFTKNNYNLGIQNGSLGVLTSTERGYQDDQDTYGLVTLDTGEQIPITEEIFDCMELGYAITLHKAQGSQFPRIVVAIQKGRISDRAWLYTAVTRAEAEVHIVGKSSHFASMAKSVSNANRRASYLKDLLLEERRGSGVSQ